MSQYNKVIICETKHKRKMSDITDMSTYKTELNKFKIPTELVGGENQSVKPYFDIDTELPKDTVFDEQSVLTMATEKIKKIFKLPNSKNIYILKRDKREKNGKYKYSYHITVDNISIANFNIKTLLDDAKITDFDTGVYDKNRALHPIYTSRKVHKEKEYIQVPEFKPYDVFKGYLENVDITKYCPSYITESFVNWDENVEEMRGKKFLEAIENYSEKEEIVVDKADAENNLKTYLNRLKPTRFEDYQGWLHTMFAIINVGFKNTISKNKIRGLVHHYSSLAANYTEDSVDKWFDTTYDKQKGKKGYGIPYILKCVKEDDKEWYDVNVGMTYANIKIEFDTRVFKCNDPIGFVEINTKQNELNPSPYYILTRSQIIEKYEDLSYFEKDEKNKVVKKSFTTKWLKDPTKKLYHNIVFVPKTLSPELAKNHFNLFKGFRAAKLPVFKDYDLIKPILDHIFVVLSKSRPEVYNFIMQWFAQIIRNPCVKTQVFIILKSEPGSGKNIILDMIGKKIIGDYAVDTASPERVFFGTFNSLMCNKVLVVCNEAGNGLRDCLDRIKDVITAPTINIEKKGKDPIVFDNNVNGIGTTNNRAPIPIPPDDRRMALFECSMEKKGNTEYFNTLGGLCEDDMAISSFYHYLLEEVDITIKNFQKDRPITEEYKKVQQLHIPNCVSYMITRNDTLQWKIYKGKSVCLLKTSDLYKNYKIYCEDCKITPYSKKNFIFDIVCGRSGILKCTHGGYECIRLLKPEYEAWIGEYKSLECEMDLENYDDLEFQYADSDTD